MKQFEVCVQCRHHDSLGPNYICNHPDSIKGHACCLGGESQFETDLSPYEVGRKSGSNCMMELECPYPKGSAERTEWEYGRAAGRAEKEAYRNSFLEVYAPKHRL